MKNALPVAASLFSLPVITYAADVQTFASSITIFLSDVVIPFLIGVAFLFFLINAIRYFVLGGANEEERDKAKALAIYGVTAFVIIIVFWGIVNMLVDSIGLGGEIQPTNDYEDLYGGP